MPIYEFECRECKRRFEKLCSFSASDSADCPECGIGGARRLMSMFASVKSADDAGSSCSCGGSCGGDCGGDCGSCGGSCHCH